jgi:hypothetical protein
MIADFAMGRKPQLSRLFLVVAAVGILAFTAFRLLQPEFLIHDLPKSPETPETPEAPEIVSQNNLIDDVKNETLGVRCLSSSFQPSDKRSHSH